MLNKFKHYVFPENPLDERVSARLKRGAINYAQVRSWWPFPGVQRWIRSRHFHFQHGTNGRTTAVAVSGADITHLWVAEEVLLEKVYQLDVVPFVPELILDLGANIGLFSLLAARAWPEASLVCVEPHPLTFEFLCENLALNAVRASRLQCALDAEPAMRFMGGDEAVYRTLSAHTTETSVMALPLDALLPRNPKLKLLIKMDIEGSEIAVLERLTAPLPESTFVFLELHNGDESLRWIEAWAEQHGFEFQEVRRREEAVDGYLARPRNLVRQEAVFRPAHEVSLHP